MVGNGTDFYFWGILCSRFFNAMFFIIIKGEELGEYISRRFGNLANDGREYLVRHRNSMLRE